MLARELLSFPDAVAPMLDDLHDETEWLATCREVLEREIAPSLIALRSLSALPAGALVVEGVILHAPASDVDCLRELAESELAAMAAGAEGE